MFLRHLVPWPPFDIHRKFYGELAKYSDLGPVESYVSETVQDRIKLVLITNRKSHMSFRLSPKSVTLNDLERRNGRYFPSFQ